MAIGFESTVFVPGSFQRKAMELFHFQYANNTVYKRFVDAINCRVSEVRSLEQIPFLPVSFFKTHKVVTTEFTPDTVFESSGTTGSGDSRHFIKSRKLYEKSFLTAFENKYGPVRNYCVLGLLPSYLERSGSSLVYMVGKMVEYSRHPASGFYLYNHADLAQQLAELERNGQRTLLIGVTYALLDFAQQYPLRLNNTVVMETGGMKGRKKEMLRSEVHEILQKAFAIETVHSEYGMTELLSQAYAQSHGLFYTPHWMKILIREEDDPFSVTVSAHRIKTGALNIIDLANIYSSAFIATDDLGRLHPDGSFEVLGRLDYSDIRGCSLMVPS